MVKCPSPVVVYQEENKTRRKQNKTYLEVKEIEINSAEHERVELDYRRSSSSKGLAVYDNASSSSSSSLSSDFLAVAGSTFLTGVAEAGTGDEAGEVAMGLPSREIFCLGRRPSLAANHRRRVEGKTQVRGVSFVEEEK